MSRRWLRGLAPGLATAWLLAACGSLPGPTALPPPPTAASGWQAPLPVAPPAAPQEAPGPDLERVLDDPELPALRQAAQAASADLASARARIERARAAQVQARAASVPQLDLGASVAAQRSQPRGDTLRSASLGMQAGWEVDLFGAASAAERAALARLRGESASREAVERSLAAEVATQLVELRACVVQRELAAASARSQEELSRLTALRLAAGMAAPAEAALARASAAQGRSAWQARQAACGQQLQALVELTALPAQALSARLLAQPSGLPHGRRFAVDQLPADLLQRRPDLQLAAAGVQAAAAAVDQSVAADWPRVSFVGNLALARVGTGGFSVQGPTWSIGPLQVSLPLLDAGQRRAARAAALAEFDAAVVAYQAALRRAVREVEQSLLALDASAAREADAEAAARDFDTVLGATAARQRAGLASLFELEDARRSALASRSAWVDLQRDRALAWISLARALGTAPAAGAATAGATPKP